MKHVISYVSVLLLSACGGNPGGMSDSEYAEYKDLGPPKILYTCLTKPDKYDYGTRECPYNKDDPAKSDACYKKLLEDREKAMPAVRYTAGVGINATYNKILADAKTACNGEFKILDSKY